MHLDEGTIHAWLDGALDAEEAKRVERHVAECDACRDAVAEARGLIAGASRILSALDDVPAAVVPPALGGAPRGQQRPRSLWNVLHFTPARAAAAAFVIVAAGTVLVLRNAPNAALPVADRQLVADSVRHVRNMPVPVSPQPAAARDSTAPKADVAVQKKSSVVPSPVPAVAPASAPALPLRGVPVSQQPRRAGRPEEQKLENVSVTATSVAARADSPSVASRAQGIRDSIARAPIASEKSVAGVGGAVPRAAMAPAALGYVRSTRAATADFVGCYEVSGGNDSTLALPSRLSLDSTRFDRPAALERAAAGGNVSLTDRHAISAITSDGRRAIEHAYWQWVPGLGARITVEGLQPRTVSVFVTKDSTPAADAAMSAKRLADRDVGLTLRRVSCPAR